MIRARYLKTWGLLALQMTHSTPEKSVIGRERKNKCFASTQQNLKQATAQIYKACMTEPRHMGSLEKFESKSVTDTPASQIFLIVWRLETLGDEIDYKR
jgi:hypothetical protein